MFVDMVVECDVKASATKNVAVYIVHPGSIRAEDDLDSGGVVGVGVDVVETEPMSEMPSCELNSATRLMASRRDLTLVCMWEVMVDRVNASEPMGEPEQNRTECLMRTGERGVGLARSGESYALA